MDLAILIGIISSALLMLILILYKIFLNPYKISRIKELIKNNNFHNVIKISQKMLEKDSNNPLLHYYLGEAFYQIQNFNNAKAEFNFLFRYNLDSYSISEESVRHRLYDIYFKSNMHDEALKELLLIIKKNPKDIETILKIGDMFKERGKWENAVSYYQKALTLDKSNFKAIFSIGEALYNKKQYNLAKKFLFAVLKQVPSSIDANYFLGLCHKELGDHRSAIIYLNKTLSDTRLGLNALYNIGMIYFNINQYDESIEAFRNAASTIEDKKSNTYLNILYALGESYQHNNMIKEAVDIWEQIYLVKNNFKDVVIKLSKFQHLKNDDNIREFLVAKNENFIEFCKKIIHYLNCKIVKIEVLNNGKIIEAQTLGSTSDWKNMDKLPVFFYIDRDISDPISKKNISDILDKMKSTKSAKGYLISPSYPLPEVEGFIATRPVEIIDRDRLSLIIKELMKEPNLYL